jgi:hypothetical protein
VEIQSLIYEFRKALEATKDDVITSIIVIFDPHLLQGKEISPQRLGT